MGTVADEVGIVLGYAPDPAVVEFWQSRARRMIVARMGQAAVDAVDPLVVQEVVVDAIARYLRNPTGVAQRTVSVDDGSLSTRYESGTSGELEILDDWWVKLGWAPPSPRGSFSIRPSYTPDVR